MPTITATFYSEDENGDEIEITAHFPAKWEICDHCRGNGTHDHPAFSNGISGEEFYGEWEPEERERYMDGFYDVSCDDCGGSGKVKVIDEDAITEDQQDDLKDYYRQLRRQAAYDRECAMERRMGA